MKKNIYLLVTLFACFVGCKENDSVEENVTMPDFNGHEYVDLGITYNGKTLYWATCNVGASSPEEYGNYYAWGETTPKELYDWSTYKWAAGQSHTENDLCKYTVADRNTDGCWYDGGNFIGDGKRILDPEDDAATANWGGSWRMPTGQEVSLLYNECSWTWTMLNGVPGVNVMGRNGNSIFLPSAGYRDIDGLRGEKESGHFFTSELSPYSLFVYRIDAWKYHDPQLGIQSIYRYLGFSIRPVCQ